MTFPFEIHGLYKAREINRTLRLGSGGGIRLNKALRIIALFTMPLHKRGEGEGNIYVDSFDNQGFYLYTGTGRSGDQSFDDPHNRWIRDASKDGRTIHVFKQSILKGPYEYLGEFEYVSHDSDTKQPDENGLIRRVLLFKLGRVVDDSVTSSEPFEIATTQRDRTILQTLTPVLTIAEKSMFAEKLVIQYEERGGRRAKSVALTPVGYDVESVNMDDETDVRYIEVKSRTGNFPVTLTSNEMRIAREKGDKYYLYVVIDERTIIRIRNPASLDLIPRYILQYQLPNVKTCGEITKIPD